MSTQLPTWSDTKPRHPGHPLPWLLLLIGIGLGLVAGLVSVVALTGLATMPWSVLRVEGASLPAGNAAAARLYILSSLVGADGVSIVGSRISILDPVTHQETFSLQTGVDVEAVPSRDGTRLYVAAIDVTASDPIGKDYLTAIDVRTKGELWRTPLKNRAKYIFGDGPASVRLSPDGRWLYVFSYPWLELSQYGMDTNVPYWIEIIDTASGRPLPETIALPKGCNAGSMFPAPRGEQMAVVCTGTSNVSFVNLRTRQVERQLAVPDAPAYYGQPGRIMAAEASPDSGRVYVMTDNYRLAVVDIAQQALVAWVDLGRQPYQAVRTMAMTPDGSRLFVGFRPNDSEPAITEVRVVDTTTLREVGRLSTGKGFTSPALAVGPDGQSVYSSTSSDTGGPEAWRDTLVQLNATSRAATPLLVRQGEFIRRIFVAP